MLSRRSFVAAGLIGATGCRRRRGAGFPGYAFVANEEGGTVAAVDLTAFAVARQIGIEGRPTAIAADPARPEVYVLTPQTGTVHAIDVGSLSIRRRARVARSAVTMRLARDGTGLWVLAREPRQLVRLDLESFRPGAGIALPWEPADFDLAPDRNAAAAVSGPEGAVCFCLLKEGRAGRPVKVGAALGAVRYRSDGRALLAANTGDRRLSILEAPGGRIMAHLPLAMRPENLCMKSDGGQLFITGEGMDAVAVVYPYRTEVAETALAGRAPGAMAASGNPDYLFVANPQTSEVTILDIETRRAIAMAAVGTEPGFIAVTPDNQYALVLNRRSGDMAVIRVAAITAKRTKTAPLFTIIPVGTRPVCAAVREV